jgi:Tfp pilus assembly protein PilZ
MNEERRGMELRKHPRISWGFIVKFRPKDKNSQWQVSTVKNISLGGCYFTSSTKFDIGESLDINAQFPTLKDPIQFKGKVKRCESQQDKSGIYGIAICFSGMDETKKKEFSDTINFFLNKQHKSR